MGQTKICRGCGLSKPTSDFYKSRGRCKVCISKQGKQRYSQNKEKILKKTAEYREAHREEINRYFRERYKNNRKEILEKQKEYASEHREEKKRISYNQGFLDGYNRGVEDAKEMVERLAGGEESER